MSRNDLVSFELPGKALVTLISSPSQIRSEIAVRVTQ